jgi:hypothetical protein
MINAGMPRDRRTRWPSRSTLTSDDEKDTGVGSRTDRPGALAGSPRTLTGVVPEDPRRVPGEEPPVIGWRRVGSSEAVGRGIARRAWASSWALVQRCSGFSRRALPRTVATTSGAGMPRIGSPSSLPPIGGSSPVRSLCMRAPSA